MVSTWWVRRRLVPASRASRSASSYPASTTAEPLIKYGAERLVLGKRTVGRTHCALSVQCGEVFEGDQICTINGSNVMFASSNEAREKLLAMRDPVLHLTLKANPPMWALYKQRMVALQLDQIEEQRLAHPNTEVRGGGK